MKRLHSLILGITLSALAVALASSAFWAGNAYAATGCFNDTNGHWAEPFICWMKDNNITTGIGGGNYGPEQFVTRAQMAVFMQKASNVPPQTGLTLVSAGNANWQTFYSTSNLSITRYSDVTRFSRPTAGLDFITVHPDFTPVLYGRSLELVGVEFCYNASANAILSGVELNVTTATNNAGNRTMVLNDFTERSDQACRYYVLPTPVVMTADNGVNFYAFVNWVTGGKSFDVGRTTFVFQPTDVVAVAPSSLSNDVAILSESTNDTLLPDTSAP